MTSRGPGNAHPSSEAPAFEDWVPVEHRWFGFDRRTLKPALAVLALAFLWAIVLPAINRSVSGSDPIEAGEVIDLASGGELRMTPATGWNLERGAILGEARAAVVTPSTTEMSYGDVQFTVTTGNFAGSPVELLEQVDAINTRLDDERGLGIADGRDQTTTAAGVPGVVEYFTGTTHGGLAAAYVFALPGGESVGVSVTAVGTGQGIARRADDIQRMMSSIAVAAAERTP